MAKLDLWLGVVVAPRNAVSTVGSRYWQIGELLREVEKFTSVIGLQTRRRPIRTVRRHVQSNFESLCDIGGCLSGTDRGRGVDIRGSTHTLPVCQRATRRAVSHISIEASGCTAVRMIISRHDDHRLKSTREVPEAWNRFDALLHLQNKIGK